jgi:hypothetical protein
MDNEDLIHLTRICMYSNLLSQRAPCWGQETKDLGVQGPSTSLVYPPCLLDRHLDFGTQKCYQVKLLLVSITGQDAKNTPVLVGAISQGSGLYPHVQSAGWP